MKLWLWQYYSIQFKLLVNKKPTWVDGEICLNCENLFQIVIEMREYIILIDHSELEWLE